MRNESRIYEQFNDYVDISGHIQFAESLIDRYEWDKETKKRLVSQLQLIHNKEKDKCLNLSVIGEFSTGKSSFINALLGEELLVSSIVQGTTVVNTVIEYYTHPVLYILMKDGTYDVTNAQNVKELRVKLSDVTTNPSSAKNIEMVRVGIPSQLLADGIRIIDTPGTNSIESWHEEVTKNALKNLSDLSIILTDAMHPLPQTLIDFIDENLADIYNQCGFVVTYYDKIKKNERNNILRYIEKKLTRELEILAPAVYPYIAPAVISDKAGEIIMPEQSEMVKISIESQKQMLELMKKNRKISQIKKLLSLTKEVFDILQINMETKKTQYEQEYRLLIKSKQTSLEPFIESEKERCVKEFINRTSELKDYLNVGLDKMIANAKSKVCGNIILCNELTAESIKSYISLEVPKECKRQADIIVQSAEAVNKSLLSTFSDIMTTYQRNFERQFKRLGIIKIDIGSIAITKPHVVSVSLSSLKSSLEYMSNEVTKDNWFIGGGGVAGAAIGTAILPGIGTVVGGFIGMVVGAMGTTSSEEIKKNACDKLSGQLDSVFLSVETDIISTYNINVSAYKRAIIKEIEQYLKEYKSTVDRKVVEYNSLIEKNKLYTERISADLKLIILRQNQLKSLSDSLKK